MQEQLTKAESSRDVPSPDAPRHADGNLRHAPRRLSWSIGNRIAASVVFADFWATWCRPCRAEIPNVPELDEAYHDMSARRPRRFRSTIPPPAAEKYNAESSSWSSIFLKEQKTKAAAGTIRSSATTVSLVSLTAILVGEHGKKLVTMNNARAPVLGEELEKALAVRAAEKAAADKATEEKGRRREVRSFRKTRNVILSRL